MSCEEFERNIYLYDELSTSEKNSIDAHLQTCASCAAVLEEVKGVQLLVRRMAEEIVPPNAARLTSGIMSKIAAEKSNQDSVFVLSLLGRTRIALTALSIFLLLTFAIEFSRDSTQFREAAESTINSSVILNSKIFRNNFSQGKVKHPALADCGNSLKAGRAYLECLKNKLK